MLVRLSVVRRASRSWSGTRQAKRSLTPSLNRKSRAAACIEVAPVALSRQNFVPEGTQGYLAIRAAVVAASS